MRAVVRPALAFTALLLVATAPTRPQPAGGRRQLARVDSILERYVALGVFSGTVLLARDGSIVLDRGYGLADRTTGRRNTANTQFRIASISKLLTGTAIARLVAQGRLAPDTRLSELVPEYRHADRMTIEQLLEHTAGVPHINDLTWYEEASRSYHTPEQLLQRINDLPLDFEPGTSAHYSNGGYLLLAMALERLTGLSYADCMRELVFDPAGMPDSGHEISADPPGRLARGYTIGLAGLEPARDVDMSIKIGGGSIYATTRDLFRWTRALWRGPAIDSILANGLWLQRQRDGHTFFYAVGHSPGFTATLLQYRDVDLTVIVLANNYARTTDDVAFQVAAGGLNEPYESGVTRYLENGAFPTVSADRDALARVTGTYSQRGPDARFRLRRAGASLVYELVGHPETYHLIPVSNRDFIDPMLWGVLHLTVAADTAGRAGKPSAPASVTGVWEWFDYPSLRTTVAREEGSAVAR